MTKIIFVKSDQWLNIQSCGLNKEDIDNFVSNDEPILRCTIPIAVHTNVYAFSCKNVILITAYKDTYLSNKREIIDVEPFIQIEPIGNAFEYYHEYTDYYNGIKKRLDTYNSTFPHSYSRTTNEAFMHLKCKAFMIDSYSEGELKFRRPNCGKIEYVGGVNNSIRLVTTFFGKSLNRDVSLNDNGPVAYLKDSWYCYGLRNVKELLKSNDGLSINDINLLIKSYLSQFIFNNIPEDGIKGIKKQKKIAEHLNLLRQNEPLIWSFFLYCHNNKVRDGSSNNTLLAAFLKTYENNYDEIKNQLEKVMHNFFSSEDDLKKCLLNLGGAKEKEEEKRAQKEWHLRKGLAEQASGLGITEDSHPKLLKAICEENIPIGVFHQPGKHNDLVNVEFDLWEKSLNRKNWDKVIFEIAKNASKRNTYARYITPYLSFLFRLENYLDRHSQPFRRLVKWSAFPSFVQSTQLDLSDEDKNENGTIKKRSALTPIVNNEKNTITVPYAAIAMHGRQTTYCYSSHYYVFEENTIDVESQSVITKDLEPGLNGRDDYGLMYYTLDGTARNQGYPTFLIIFERRKYNTHVHFHRVHPSRIKDGVKVPACRLIEECYRYMAGNVRAEEILCQQGDLLFLKAEEPKNYDSNELKGILEFESHQFHPHECGVIKLLENKNKSIKNRLGFIYCNEKFSVKHPEHESTPDLESGWYEVRRCKSWEANPAAVWSYTID